MAHKVVEHGLKNVSEFWGIEVPLYFPRVYAGTTDGAGIHLNEEAILDYKQTNRPKRRDGIDDYFLQLCAYAIAHNEVYGTDINCGVILMCSKDLILQEFVLEGDEFEKYTHMWWDRVEQFYRER
jgi:genome maintenance exonuclease 1